MPSGGGNHADRIEKKGAIHDNCKRQWREAQEEGQGTVVEEVEVRGAPVIAQRVVNVTKGNSDSECCFFVLMRHTAAMSKACQNGAYEPKFCVERQSLGSVLSGDEVAQLCRGTTYGWGCGSSTTGIVFRTASMCTLCIRASRFSRAREKRTGSWSRCAQWDGVNTVSVSAFTRVLHRVWLSTQRVRSLSLTLGVGAGTSNKALGSCCTERTGGG